MVPRFSRPAKALLLRFPDASALWLSEAGARLATDAAPESNAHRLAKAHAERAGWVTLFKLSRWPVPCPRMRGDWLTVPKAGFTRLYHYILRSADIAELPDAPPLGDVFAALTADEGHNAIWTIPGAPGSLPSLLLMSSAVVAGNRGTWRARLDDLQRLAQTDPARLVVWLEPARELFWVRTASEVANKLRHSLSQTPAPAPVPQAEAEERHAVASQSTATEARHEREEDDDPTPPERGF